MSFKTAIYTVVFILAAGMVVTLLVFWPVFIIRDYHTIRELYEVTHGNPEIPAAGRWTVLVLGIVFLSLVLVVLAVFFSSLMRGARFKRQQKDFVNMMTHELKLPMSSIQMFAQTMRQRETTPEERSSFLDAMLNDCARMNTLLDHLLKSQQIERGRLPVQKRKIDVRQFLEKFASSWPRPLRMRVAGGGEDPVAQADPVLLELALTNLVSNAEKYGKGSVPEIGMETDRDEIHISVSDLGTPIPPKYAKKIFKRFFRIPSRETRRQNGAGLGLYIVKSIVRMHKGSVDLSHAAGNDQAPVGNRFTLNLPRSA
jgi:two-component system phosphate regulon sensor histidine kinase PhoR